MRLVEALLSMANGYRTKVKLPTKPGMIIIDFYDKDNFSITYEGVKSRLFKDEFSFGILLRHLNDEVEIVEDRCECIDKDVEKLFEEETENEFTGCKWFVRGKETMSMDYEDSENWFKAKELIESLSYIEKNEEEKDIEEINEIIRFQDLATPYGHNEQMFMKFLIIHQNKIDELVRAINSIKKEKNNKEN